MENTKEELPLLIGTAKEVALYVGIPIRNVSAYAKRDTPILKKWKVKELC